jgi:hypothetical protein
MDLDHGRDGRPAIVDAVSPPGPSTGRIDININPGAVTK